MDRKPIGVGRTAEVFEETEFTVLKLFYAHFPSNLAEREYRISHTISQLGLSTPKPVGRLILDGRQGIVYERIRGLTMVRLLGQKPWRCIKEARRLAELHHEIHKLHISNDLDLPKLRDDWSERISNTTLLNDAEKQEIQFRLNQMQDGDQLCHGDLHPDNVIIGDQVWIMDWMTGMIGNSAADAARTALILRTGALPSGAPKLLIVIIKIIQGWMSRAYMRHYLKLSGRTGLELEAWSLFAAAARLVESISDEEKQQLVRMIQSKLKGDGTGGYRSQTNIKREL
ncbi:phosphotransferase family protein [Paenibacillus sedimenti]|uniref:Phosphotransferase n=1 Tax=Paenibacillus sedimenti TaxID=2770274 RepID=A0A926KUC0_9BACL|nr:aminoglycoside phosphotransferase family protein [Paenibacillus sedimenti]MBD0383031.1 phosphotransferase [Paenibacillus sedimenti]